MTHFDIRMSLAKLYNAYFIRAKALSRKSADAEFLADITRLEKLLAAPEGEPAAEALGKDAA